MSEGTKSERPRRSRGDGAIYPTKDGRVRGALLVTDTRTGRQVRKFVSGRSRAAVSRKLDDLKRDASSGVSPRELRSPNT